jgi:hypothetical protein
LHTHPARRPVLSTRICWQTKDTLLRKTILLPVGNRLARRFMANDHG